MSDERAGSHVTGAYGAGRYSEKKNRMLRFLQENPVGVLSTVTPDGAPHGVVIYFAVQEDFVISFITKTATHKFDTLVRDGRAYLTVLEPSTQAVVQVSGHASEVFDGPMVDAIARDVMEVTWRTNQSWPAPITKLDAGRYTAFQITPQQIQMVVYARPDPGGYAELFETIDSFELEE